MVICGCFGVDSNEGGDRHDYSCAIALRWRYGLEEDNRVNLLNAVTMPQKKVGF